MKPTEAEFFSEVKSYVGFSESDRETLIELGPLLEPYVAGIVNRFYEAIMAHGGAAAVLSGPEQIERLKGFLNHWVRGLFAGVYDNGYYEQRARIGMVHVRVGLEQRYMITGLNVIRVALHEALRDALRDSAWSWDDVFRAADAIDKICDIELSIMMESYRENYILKHKAENETLAAMGRLTAGLAHEVRNPLNAAKLQLEVLQRALKKIESESYREQMSRRTEVVKSELSRLSALLDDFLNLARPTSLQPEPFEMRDLLQEVIELEGPLLDALKIEFALEFGQGALAEHGDCTVHGERNRIKQVVLNLLSNAVEALQGDEDALERRITIECDVDENRWLVMSIKDTGPGIKRELVPRMFESFVTTKDDGTGLGLAVVKKIVGMHGGRIELAPLEPRGTRATFTIPMSEP